VIGARTNKIFVTILGGVAAEKWNRPWGERKTMIRICALWAVGVVCIGFLGCGGNSSVQGALPGIGLSQTTAFFGANFGLPFDPAPVNVKVTNSGGGTLTFTATSDSPWLTVTPGSGTAPAAIGVTALLGTLPVGTYTGHVTVSAAGVQDSPGTITVTFVVSTPPANAPFWAQWGANPQHTGVVGVVGQNAANQLADIVYDPFVSREQSASGGELLAHYPAPITDGNDVYFMTKSGTYTGANSWSNKFWNAAVYFC
jgi:hypothetical protein